MTIIQRLRDNYVNFFDTYSDPRVKDYFLMQTPTPVVAIVIFYVFFVKVLGPRLMENRKPFQINKILIVYNFLQVLLSSYIFYKGATLGWLTDFSWRCEPYNPDSTPKELAIIQACYVYFFSKLPELLDTVFFVMRKRYDQVSTLHVIHHGIMPLSVWVGMKFRPGGHATFFGFLNSGVHIIMYAYYMLAAMGPNVQKYLWWKKYLTLIQMIQFIGIIIHSTQLYFYNPCNFSIAYANFITAHAVMFLVLFSLFYRRSYIHKSNNKSIKIEAKKIN